MWTYNTVRGRPRVMRALNLPRILPMIHKLSRIPYAHTSTTSTALCCSFRRLHCLQEPVQCRIIRNDQRPNGFAGTDISVRIFSYRIHLFESYRYLSTISSSLFLADSELALCRVHEGYFVGERIFRLSRLFQRALSERTSAMSYVTSNGQTDLRVRIFQYES